MSIQLRKIEGKKRKGEATNGREGEEKVRKINGKGRNNLRERERDEMQGEIECFTGKKRQ